MSCQQVPTAPAFNPYPRSVQVGEFEVAIGGGIWVAIGAHSVVFAMRLVREADALCQQVLLRMQPDVMAHTVTFRLGDRN